MRGLDRSQIRGGRPSCLPLLRRPGSHRRTGRGGAHCRAFRGGVPSARPPLTIALRGRWEVRLVSWASPKAV